MLCELNADHAALCNIIHIYEKKIIIQFDTFSI